MRVVLGIPGNRKALEAVLEGLTRLNEHLIRVGRLPRLYEAGVRYVREKRRQRIEGVGVVRRVENWQNAADLLASRRGDCEDLGTYLAAERRVYDGDGGARAIAHRSGPGRFHTLVERGDGTREDPSRRLGMGRRARR